MPRTPRMIVPGVALHVVQRGNNRQAVFFNDSNYIHYLNTLFESAEKYDVSVHAYVCMTNHVHILMTPGNACSASRMMQRLGASYAAGMNSVYERTGSLWEGRFKSSLVDTKRYLLACYRYIELNPVCAGTVEHPAEYRWSSYRHHAIELSEYPIWPHAEWLALGSSMEERRIRYGELFADALRRDEVELFRSFARKGLPAGSKRFRAEIEEELDRRIGDGRRGRPKKGL